MSTSSCKLEVKCIDHDICYKEKTTEKDKANAGRRGVTVFNIMVLKTDTWTKTWGR